MITPEWLDQAVAGLEKLGRLDPKQHQLLTGCRDLINKRIPAEEPLWQACRHADVCWRREAGEKPEPMLARLPFIGPQYPSKRIAVVAINSRDDGLPDAEVRAAVQVVRRLRSGHRDYGRNSYFHYRVAAAVHAAVASQAGAPPDDKPRPEDAADSLLASARLQAVQCSPIGTSRRTPTPEMTDNCPEFLLRGQLELLAPDLLILLGHPAHRAIEAPKLEMHWETTWAQSGRCFSRGRTNLAGRPLTVCALSHPSSRGWQRSWHAYLDSLTDQPFATNR